MISERVWLDITGSLITQRLLVKIAARSLFTRIIWFHCRSLRRKDETVEVAVVARNCSWADRVTIEPWRRVSGSA